MISIVTTKWRKKTSMQRNLWRKKCLAMPYHSKNTTNILVCSRFRHFSQSEDLQQINTSIFDIYSYHISDMSILALWCFCPNVLKGHQTHTSPPWWSATSWSLPICSIKKVISLERDANRERNKSATTAPGWKLPIRVKAAWFFAKGRNVRKKTVQWLHTESNLSNRRLVRSPRTAETSIIKAKRSCTPKWYAQNSTWIIMDHGSCCSKRLHPREFGV